MSDPLRYYPFTNLVDMSHDAIARRLEKVSQLNSLCAWLGQAEPVEEGDRIAEEPSAYGDEEIGGRDAPTTK